MEEKEGARGSLADVYRYSGLGCMFAAGILVFMAVGWLIDRRFGVLPAFTALGALVGAALSSVSVYRKLKAGERDREPPAP